MKKIPGEDYYSEKVVYGNEDTLSDLDPKTSVGVVECLKQIVPWILDSNIRDSDSRYILFALDDDDDDYDDYYYDDDDYDDYYYYDDDYDDYDYDDKE